MEGFKIVHFSQLIKTSDNVTESLNSSTSQTIINVIENHIDNLSPLMFIIELSVLLTIIIVIIGDIRFYVKKRKCLKITDRKFERIEEFSIFDYVEEREISDGSGVEEQLTPSGSGINSLDPNSEKPEDIKNTGEETEIVNPTINPVKRISYIPSDLYVSNELKYPVVKYPKLGTVIKFPRTGRSANKGFTEDDFLEYLIKYFKPEFSVYTNHHVTQKNSARPYEPDFVIANEKGNKNIFINIEIDEPYDGINRTPTHIIDQDTYRDNFFINRGYIVGRFSEIQIHTMPLGCCKVLAEIINSIDSTFTIDTELKKSVLTDDNQWDSLQSKKWAKEKYRENYLGIQSFGFAQQADSDYKIINDKEDIEVEENVVETVPLVPKKVKKDFLEKENSNARDERITFDEKKHKYYIDKNADTISVSQLIDKFFPEFDAYSAASKLNPRHKYFGIDPSEVVDIWKKEGLEKALLGTYLHEQIENYYNKKDYDATSQEFQYFLNFENTFQTMIPFRTEWRIFDEELLIAGTIDKIYKKNENSYYMFDWKRSEKVVDAKGNPLKSDPCDSYTEFAAGELSHLTNDSYYKYCLQQNLYRHILETRYNFKISSMNLLILHPSYNNFKWVSIPEMKNEIEYILKISKSRF